MKSTDLAVPLKQTQLSGATVGELGMVVAASSTRTFGYALIEGANRVTHRGSFTALNEVRTLGLVCNHATGNVAA